MFPRFQLFEPPRWSSWHGLSGPLRRGAMAPAENSPAISKNDLVAASHTCYRVYLGFTSQLFSGLGLKFGAKKNSAAPPTVGGMA